MVSVHGSALKGYEAAAGTYVAGRPDYPPEAARWLAEIVGLAPGRRVLEIGAGTGKFVGLLRKPA
jgi:protein-L-isoaspartate O-methyltransferase